MAKKSDQHSTHPSSLTVNQFRGLLKGKKRNKFNAVKAEADNIMFDSTRERDFYSFLTKSGLQFEKQVVMTLAKGVVYQGKKLRDVEWVPDFVFPKIRVIIDVKGMVLPEARLKMKLFLIYKHSIGEMDWNIWIVYNKSLFQKTVYCIRKRMEGNPDIEQEKHLTL